MNRKLFAGCDVGSTTGKAVLLNSDGILGQAVCQSEIDPEETAKKVLAQACEMATTNISPNDITYLIGTGYGRREVPFANENISEITCHAMGAFSCLPETRTIIDIGGQDVKAISVGTKGDVLDFAMNDKCAAGTGRFFEMMAKIFRMDIELFSDLSLQSKKTIAVTSQCSVFAETEVITLLAKRKNPADIAAGIQTSVARRCFTLMKKTGIEPLVTITGGCSKNKGLVKALEKKLRMPIQNLPIDPQLMGAYGAAVMAMKRYAG
ncbi:MAG: CoA-substrate-specific enzyme activase [Candidatus Magnetoglobus multicellularis str. Araruama]|uniref:CoA-substrate-specific enzyme activase n=1 Tax=Candidatus Magnetoglobus multicellularis str. Araruama TaxID=890399 RepID=A0A1V1PI71_9BACT|nr:MAG: CoA-substrate-specific enzyme activase [Candidatus Magnetoglobus multicellularis str. Araruama]